MTAYDFRLVLSGLNELTDDVADRLFAAGSDDATPSSSDGTVSIDYSRVAADLESAISSAIANVSAAGYAVARAEIDVSRPIPRDRVLTPRLVDSSEPVAESTTEQQNEKSAFAGCDEAFSKIDAMVARIRSYAIEPEFSNDVARRELAPDFDLPDNQVLKTMITLIAFSQQVPASRIVDMVDRGVLQRIFGHFSPVAIARLDPEELRQQYWAREWLSPIRFRGKVDKMVSCARGLLEIGQRHGSYMNSLNECQFPLQINTPSDVKMFWTAFEKARSTAPAFYKNFTSLCHLLQSLGFPCSKPDRIVMNVAEELDVVTKRTQHSEAENRKVVTLMQVYAAHRQMHVPVVDLFFLIQGGQTDAKKFVKPSYYQ